MPTVASLDVLLSADVSKFSAGLGVAGQKLFGFKAGPVALAVEAVQALGRAFVDVVNEMDDAGDKAANLGVAVSELTRLQFAAEKLGGSSESLDRALSELQKRMPDIATNTGDAAKAIERLGLDTAKFSSLDSATAFREVVKAMSGMSSQTEKVGVAYDLFGKSARDLFSILTGGEKTLNDQRNLSDLLGNTITEAESAAADAAKGGFADLAAAWRGLKQELVGLSPILTFAAREATRVVSVFRDITGLAAADSPGMTSNQNTSQSANLLFARAEQERQMMEKLADEESKLREEADRAAEESAKEAADVAEREMKRQQKEQQEAIDKMIEAQQELADSARDVWEQTRSPAEAAALEIDRLNGLFVQGYLDADTFARRLEQMREEFTEPVAEQSLSASAGAALQAGSSAAISALVEARNPKVFEDIPIKQLEEQRRSRDLLTRIALGIEELTGVPVDAA